MWKRTALVGPFVLSLFLALAGPAVAIEPRDASVMDVAYSTTSPLVNEVIVVSVTNGEDPVHLECGLAGQRVAVSINTMVHSSGNASFSLPSPGTWTCTAEDMARRVSTTTINVRPLPIAFTVTFSPASLDAGGTTTVAFTGGYSPGTGKVWCISEGVEVGGPVFPLTDGAGSTTFTIPFIGTWACTSESGDKRKTDQVVAVMPGRYPAAQERLTADTARSQDDARNAASNAASASKATTSYALALIDARSAATWAQAAADAAAAAAVDYEAIVGLTALLPPSQRAAAVASALGAKVVAEKSATDAAASALAAQKAADAKKPKPGPDPKPTPKPDPTPSGGGSGDSSGGGSGGSGPSPHWNPDSVIVQPDGRTLAVKGLARVGFATESSALKNKDRVRLQRFAKRYLLGARNAGTRVIVHGFVATKAEDKAGPRFRLDDRRSIAVFNYLTKKMKVPVVKVDIAGGGVAKPGSPRHGQYASLLAYRVP